MIVLDRPSRIALRDFPAAAPKGVDRKECEGTFAKIDAEIAEMQELLWGAKERSLLIVLQGRDASGKDGTVKHVCSSLNPRGVNVAAFGVPTEKEHAHDFLWRVHHETPGRGEIAIFNRSHYEDVLAVRVHGLAEKRVWKHRFDQINAFEEMLAAEGTIILKFFLNVSKGEQKRRLLEREADPLKAYKLNPGDWEERRKWKEFTAAYEDVLGRCAKKHAPWIVVPADDKWYRNFVVARSVAEALRPHCAAWRERLTAQSKKTRLLLKKLHD
jgi:PPK2 family polyphosphate:nucleotide phosphotransferase